MDNMIRVSVSEAAKLFGVSQKTIRLAIKNQQVKYIVVTGRYKINFSSLVHWSQSNARLANKLNRHGLGQYVDRWKIRNTKFSPSDKLVRNSRSESD